MFPQKEIKKYRICDSGIEVTILESGNICEIRNGVNRINLFSGNNLEPTVNNIYLKLNNKENDWTRMIGVGSPAKFYIDKNRVIYKGLFKDIDYTIIFQVFKNAFIFEVTLSNIPKDTKPTIFYGMDVGINNIFAINNNEAYSCQYVDHTIFEEEVGYVIASRQNQGDHLYLEQGSLTNNDGYCTDAFQFFGEEYKLTNIPRIMKENINLPNCCYQYEYAYVALASKTLTNENKKAVFYGVYDESHNDKVTKTLYSNYIKDLYKNYFNNEINIQELKNINFKNEISFENIITSLDLDKNDLTNLYGAIYQEEKQDEKLVSFFTETKSHVVLREKEKYLERPSGNILITGGNNLENILATTCYIYGLFNSQIVCGNTSFNKLLSNQRNPLNVSKISGQRIFIKLDKWYLLTMPSAFEMGINYCKWIYKFDNDILIFKSVASSNISQIQLSFQSINNIKYEIIVTNHLTMSQNENECSVFVNKENDILYCDFDKSSMAHQKYPDLRFAMKLDCDFNYNNDSIFYQNDLSLGENLLTISLKESRFTLLIKGINNNEEISFFKEEKEIYEYSKIIDNLINNFSISINSKDDTINKYVDSFNYLFHWYTHDALIHFSSPHGLEQYNGAAWGTRDVCQGPAEFFMAIERFDIVRNIIKSVYSHQYFEDGNFPQWFMFDKFSYIQDKTSHGDIIVWPARLLGIYLRKTSDFSILQEKVVYTDSFCSYTKEKYTIFDHLQKEIDNIKNHFIKDTYLSCYGGGDWDDTLQPALKEDKKTMVSSWTVSLTYDMFETLSDVLKGVYPNTSYEYHRIAQNMKNDYYKYLIKDKVPAGFIKFKDNMNIEHIIHPSDNETTIKYRLLPMTRGIISELFSKEEANEYLDLINDNLLYPDGVRLMDKTVPYNGGINTHFTRAETAANFGREIGLQYCHAHIRYCEALAKMSKKSIFDELLKINPIIINSVVKNSNTRQRNSYFSSSDACFNTRYLAMENYHLLKEGKVNVKGGWRIYSSGPGIYINILITGLLGINVRNDKITFNPTLDYKLDNLFVKYRINNKDISIRYHVKKTNNRNITINSKNVIYEEFMNKYGRIEFIIDSNSIKNNDIIDIYLN